MAPPRRPRPQAAEADRVSHGHGPHHHHPRAREHEQARPGETLDADLAAACLRRLNSIADDWSAGRDMMPQDQTDRTVSGGPSLTLGSGSFAAIAAGDEIIAMQADVPPMDPITIQQYNAIPVKTRTGRPQFWCADGLATVYLYPVAGQTCKHADAQAVRQLRRPRHRLHLPSGYQGAFAASLAVAMAPALLGKVTPACCRPRRKALFNVRNAQRAPGHRVANPLRPPAGGNILTGWN
jgi:hypothetical protein